VSVQQAETDLNTRFEASASEHQRLEEKIKTLVWIETG